MILFLDTSICVDVLRTSGPKRSLALFERFSDGRNTGIVSAITVAELAAGAALSSRKDAMKKTEELLAYVEVADMDESVAMAGGKIYGKLSQAGKKIELNDCLIAATLLSLGMDQIVTRNCDHFNRIEGCSAVTPEDLAIWILILKRISTKDDISDEEMYRTFNMGMGYAYVVPEKSVACVLKMVKGAQVVGEVVKEPGAWLGEMEIT